MEPWPELARRPEKTHSLHFLGTTVDANRERMRAAAAAAAAAPSVRVRKTDRVQAVLESISGRKRTPIESAAVSLVVSYSSDMAYRVLEDAAVLAKHRGAKEIDSSDVNLVLMKRYNIVMPPVDGVQRVTLHKETLPSSYAPLDYYSLASEAVEEIEDDFDELAEAAAASAAASASAVAPAPAVASVALAPAKPKGAPPKKKKAKEG